MIEKVLSKYNLNLGCPKTFNKLAIQIIYNEDMEKLGVKILNSLIIMKQKHPFTDELKGFYIIEL